MTDREPPSAAVVETTKRQRRAASPRASSWVSANAGSGKTRVLVDRVARLLLAGTPPSKILCVTYTKAAAAEMTNRLFKRLGEWTVAQEQALLTDLSELEGREVTVDELPAARRLFAQALETPGGLKIQTLHAFCQSVLARFPLEAGIAHDAQVLEDVSARALLREQIHFTNSSLTRDPDHPLSQAYERVSARIEAGTFEEQVAQAMNNRALSKPLKSKQRLAELIDTTAEALGIDPDRRAADVIDEAMAAGTLPWVEMQGIVDVLRSGKTTDRKCGDTLALFFANKSAKSFAEDYLPAFLTQKMTARKTLMTKDLANAHPAALASMEREQDRLLAIVPHLVGADRFEIGKAFLTLCQQVVERLEEEKAHRGLLEFRDLIDATTRLIASTEQASWVLFKLDEGVDHILVDEAQDTSPEQWAILRQLADEFFSGKGRERKDEGPPARTVFAVGDEKQSIYGFQGADPSAFGLNREAFAEKVKAAQLPWEPVGLDVSFRSVPEVLAAVDRVFALPEAAEGVTFSHEPIAHRSSRANDHGLIEIWPPVEAIDQGKDVPWDAPLDRQGRSSPQAMLAGLIAQTIRRWLDDGEAYCGGTPVKAGDIMILVRRRDSFVDHLSRALKRVNVPIAGTDRLKLIEHIGVLDLLALADFALITEDDLSLAVVLKSPLIGMSEEELFDLAHDRQGSLFKALRERAEADEGIARIVVFLDEARKRAARLSPFDFYSWVLTSDAPKGGSIRQAFLKRLGPDAEDPLTEFVATTLQFERVEPPVLQGFVDWFRAGGAEIKREMDTANDEVRILTVHGAKGLESKIVILPDTCGVPSGQNEPLFRAGDYEGQTVALWGKAHFDGDDPVSDALKEAQERARREEYHRLLYVAMTRAEDRLYVCGQHGPRGRQKNCWYDLIEKALVPQAVEIELPWGETGYRIGVVPPLNKAEAPLDDRKALPPVWLKTKPPTEPARRVFRSPSRLEGALGDEPSFAEQAPSPLAFDPPQRFRRGRLIHTLLEHLPLLPEADWEARARAYLSMPAHDLPAGEAEALTAEIMGVLTGAETRDLFGPDSLAEVPIAGKVPGVEGVVSGRIDRLCVREHDVLVLDFKTNRPVPASIDAVPKLYLRQLRAYELLLAALYPDREVSSAFLWTDAPKVMPIPAALMRKITFDS